MVLILSDWVPSTCNTCLVQPFGGGTRLVAAPYPERRMIRVVPRDVGHAPVGLLDLAQLLELLLPSGLEGIEDEPNLRRARATQLSESGKLNIAEVAPHESGI